MIMAMDTFVSILFTSIFLRPIVHVLREGSAFSHATETTAQREMWNTVYATLFGSSLAVITSALLYLNLLMFYNGRHDFVVVYKANIWLNPFVVFGNVDSMCNDLGVLFVYGAFKRRKTEGPRRDKAVVPAETQAKGMRESQ